MLLSFQSPYTYKYVCGQNKSYSLRLPWISIVSDRIMFVADFVLLLLRSLVLIHKTSLRNLLSALFCRTFLPNNLLHCDKTANLTQKISSMQLILSDWTVVLALIWLLVFYLNFFYIYFFIFHRVKGVSCNAYLYTVQRRVACVRAKSWKISCAKEERESGAAVHTHESPR